MGREGLRRGAMSAPSGSARSFAGPIQAIHIPNQRNTGPAAPEGLRHGGTRAAKGRFWDSLAPDETQLRQEIPVKVAMGDGGDGSGQARPVFEVELDPQYATRHVNGDRRLDQS